MAVREFSSDDEFSAVEEMSSCYPVSAGSIKKGSFMVMSSLPFSVWTFSLLAIPLERPVRVSETMVSKVGKHGHAKIRIIGVDIFNGKKYEEIHPSSHNVLVPYVGRADYTLVDVHSDGFLSLMNSKGDIIESLKLPEGEIGEQIQASFDSSEDEIIVNTISAMGMEQICGMKKA